MAASMSCALFQLSRLSIGTPPCRSFITQCGPLAFRATMQLNAEPMKKRRKQDINIIIQRETKKRRRLEKAIRKLEAKGRKLKPIEEIEGDRDFLKTLDVRQREPTVHSFEELEGRVRLEKEWSRHKYREFLSEMAQVKRAMHAQEHALQELRLESEELYQAAIKTDPSLIPFESTGPVNTPPIENYEAPDGDYIDTTRRFDK